jgi:CRP-like cAMP-binding protein
LVVVQGHYELRDGDTTVGQLTSGEHAGATTLFQARPARSAMVAAEPSWLLRMEGPRFERLIRERPWLGIGLLERLGTRLSEDLDRSFGQREGSGEAVADGERF